LRVRGITFRISDIEVDRDYIRTKKVKAINREEGIKGEPKAQRGNQEANYHYYKDKEEEKKKIFPLKAFPSLIYSAHLSNTSNLALVG